MRPDALDRRPVRPGYGVLRAAAVALAVSASAAAILAGAGCAKPPAVLEMTIVEDTTDTIGPYVVYASVIDDHGIDEVGLRYLDGESPNLEFFVRVPMDEVEPGIFRGEIPGFPVGTLVNYFVAARDVDGLTTREPTSPVGDTYQRFRIVSPLPCEADAECEPGQICDRESFQCRLQPSACNEDADCPRAAACDTGTGACVFLPATCTWDTDCGGDEICDAALMLCTPRPTCQSDAECDGGRSCVPSFGLCFATCATGDDCASHEVCAGGICGLE